MEPHKSFGIILRKLRKEKGLSQFNLALDCDLDRTYISLLERGKRQPTLKTIMKIAEILNVLPSDLLREIEGLLEIKIEQ